MLSLFSVNFASNFTFLFQPSYPEVLPADLTQAPDHDALPDQDVLPTQLADTVESRYVSLKKCSHKRRRYDFCI